MLASAGIGMIPPTITRQSTMAVIQRSIGFMDNTSRKMLVQLYQSPVGLSTEAVDRKSIFVVK